MLCRTKDLWEVNCRDYRIIDIIKPDLERTFKTKQKKKRLELMQQKV